MPVRVIHHDERLLVLDKPTGLLSVPGIGPDKQDCLATRAAAEYSGARIVHRLDRDTSGVIVMALDAEAHRELSRQFQDREVAKRYIAVVAGLVEEDEGLVDLPMRKDLEDTPRQIIDHVHGRSAQTRWRVVERLPAPSGNGAGGGGSSLSSDSRALAITRLELTPITGRSHQLRLHLKTIGHPILGDDLYAPPDVREAADRLLLHAESLSIVHPSNASPMTFASPCPF